MGRERALITGVTGQDGSYLAEYLLSLGYEVHGLIRHSSSFNSGRIRHILQDVHVEGTQFYLHYGDLTDSNSLANILGDVQPDEVYHLAAQSHVRVSFDGPTATGDVTALGTTRLLETLRLMKSKARFYQASSSEMFGGAAEPLDERAPLRPRSPYAAAKVYAYWTTVNFREAYGISASNGILFNHESPRRGDAFVTRKVTKMLARLLSGTSTCMYLGNLEARRDWGFAPEYVRAMHLINHYTPSNDFVVGTGVSRTVREFVEHAFSYAGIELTWKGEGIQEHAVAASIDRSVNAPFEVGSTLVRIDPYYYRPTEVDCLQANISAARCLLGWEPSIGFEELVHIMVDHDLAKAGLPAPGRGFQTLDVNGYGWTDHAFAEID